MNNREFDRIFRERLENFETEPPMHLWGNIVEARTAARRPWLLWSGGFGMLALTAGIGIWLMSASGNQPDAVANGAFPIPVEAALPAPVAAGSEEAAAIPAVAPLAQGVAERETEQPARQEQSALVQTAEETGFAQEETAAPAALVASFDALGAAQFPPLACRRFKDGFPENSCRPFSKEKWGLNWYAEVVGSPEYVFRSLSPRAKEFADYAEARSEMEEIRGGFSAGLRLSAVTDFGLSLRTGLQYSQINEVLNFRDPDDVRIIVTNVYDGSGNIIGSDTIYEAGTHIRITYNRYRMVDLPVMLGYEFQFPRFSMTVHGGAIFNMAFAKKGDILSPEGDPVGINSSEAFRDRMGLSLAGGIGFNYRLRPDLQFVLEPQFRVVLDPVTRSDYPLRQEYFLTGINLGLRYKL
jgi:hypothetical protein